jgi:hypothetical protein
MSVFQTIPKVKKIRVQPNLAENNPLRPHMKVKSAFLGRTDTLAN